MPNDPAKENVNMTQNEKEQGSESKKVNLQAILIWGEGNNHGKLGNDLDHLVVLMKGVRCSIGL